jgi:hypothetical protein
MATADDILADSLKEATRQAHRHIVFGTSAALFLLLLAVQDWWGGGEKSIKVPFVDVSASRALAEAIAGVAYFISGYLAYLAVSRARRIMRRLDTAPDLREAVLMYPSIPTIVITGARIAALILPVLIFLASTIPFLFMLTGDLWQALLVIIGLANTPWILLIQQLRYPLSRVRYRLTAQGLDRLKAGGVQDDLLTRLKSLQDTEYPNRDEFLRALQKTVGSISSGKVRRFILVCACEEDGIED